MPDTMPTPPEPGGLALSERYGTAAAIPAAAWNDVLATLLGHRSVRAYLPDALPEDTVPLLVAAAQSAASSSNLQVWSVVAVTDPERRARLAELAGGQRHVAAAPLLLVWLADLSRADRLGAARQAPISGTAFLESFIVAVVDAALAAQNAAVAAESLGLGICYIGAVRNHPERVAAELGLPPNVFAVFGMTVGHPDPAAPAAVKPRLPQDVVLHHEHYGTAAEASGIAAYDESLTRFQESERMKPVGWSRAVLGRLRDGGSLSGRDRIAAALRGMGFGLR